ncbi:MAG: efflux RND transporter periplasmic adaptor subunit [Ignavibacteria bacterium]|jgi:RND family efflux transporter MFP subunit|nr:efflux RND transporter periplasmic adaptor subunit [Ignavibacteria bacterium]
MKKMKVTLSLTAMIAVIIAILFMNKASRESQVEKSVTTDKITVSVEPAQEETVSDELSIVGTIQSNNDVMVVSETQGRTLKVFFKTGDYVREGTPLAQVDDELKKAAYTTAKVNFEKAKKDLQRMEALFKEKNISDSDLENARLAASAAEAQFIAAQRTLNDTKIKAPISGIIADKFINPGTMVAPGTPVANIIDISKLKVRVNVPERDVFRLKTGETAILTTDVYPGTELKGKIETISSKSDNAHTYPVEIVLPNNSRTPLKAGMFAQVRFTSITNRQSLTIQRGAIVTSIKNPKIFVVENGVAKLRDIIAGKETNRRVEVLGGLRHGENVVVSGQNNLSDNARVTIN